FFWVKQSTWSDLTLVRDTACNWRWRKESSYSAFSNAYGAERASSIWTRLGAQEGRHVSAERALQRGYVVMYPVDFVYGWVLHFDHYNAPQCIDCTVPLWLGASWTACQNPPAKIMNPKDTTYSPRPALNQSPLGHRMFIPTPIER
ncbi:arid bright domain protein, partial [Moniliophthora roreri]